MGPAARLPRATSVEVARLNGALARTVEITDAEALEQALGCDAVFHRVGNCDAAH